MKKFEKFREELKESIGIIDKEIEFSKEYIHNKEMFERYQNAVVAEFGDNQVIDFKNWINKAKFIFLGEMLAYFETFMQFLSMNAFANIDEIRLTYIKRQLYSSLQINNIPALDFEIDNLDGNNVEDYLEGVCQQLFNEMMRLIEIHYITRNKKYATEEYKKELLSTKERYNYYLEAFSNDKVNCSFTNDERMQLMRDLRAVGINSVGENNMYDILEATYISEAPEAKEEKPEQAVEVIESTKPVIVEEKDKIILFNSLRDDARRTLTRLKEINKAISIALTRGVINNEYREYLNETLSKSATAINSIENDIQPMIETVINGLDSNEFDDADNYYYDLIEGPLLEYKTIITEWYKRQAAMRQDNVQPNNNLQGTENLALCFDSSFDLSDEGIRKEFEGIIRKLEYRTSIALYKDSSRKGFTSLEKSTASNKRGDFISYLEKNYGAVDFEPLLISSSSSYRTCVIKFNPTAIVKDHLEKRYGISKTAVCLGVFAIVSADGSDHSGYGVLENYVIDNYDQIEGIARLFASDNSNYEQLDAVVDRMLEIKEEKLNAIKNGNTKK